MNEPRTENRERERASKQGRGKGADSIESPTASDRKEGRKEDGKVSDRKTNKAESFRHTQIE